MDFQLRRMQLIRLALFIVVIASGINFMPSVHAQEQAQAGLGQFDALTELSGWVLLDRGLFWTSDAGQSWEEIGPSIPSEATVQDVEFIPPNAGWMLWTTPNHDGAANFSLAHTLDHGTTWDVRALALFESGEVAAHFDRAGMGWSDAQGGWIAVKQAGSSNFSLGTLFRTSDGGVTWTRSVLPVADRVSFSDPQIGWAVGGPGGDQVFKTQDGGGTWQDAKPEIESDSSVTVYEPFYADGFGLLVTTRLGAENSLDIYAMDDSTGTWMPAGQTILEVEPGMIGLSILDPRNLVATIPGTRSILRMKDGGLDVLKNRDGLSASIVELDMVSLEAGWARSVESNCVAASPLDLEPASVSCASATRLLWTNDGGSTWQEIQLPTIGSDVKSQGVLEVNRSVAMTSIANLGNTEVFIGQGFDKCTIPTISQLQTWWDGSPYKTVNLYIGGSSRACANNVLTKSYLEELYQQGWKFFPTWVGPQAPCTGYLSRMSPDPVTAYAEGVNEANLAVERLAQLGLTYPDKTGSVVYYDIEYYGTNPACREAVNAFMDGWVSQLHVRGNLAGVYGSTLCDTGLSDFRSIPNVPDVIWPARWYHNLGAGFHDPNATVWNLGACVPNTVWADHQRIRQYEGGHDETWGELTLNIDSNVLDGVVAVPYLLPYVISIKRVHVNPTDSPSVDFKVTFTEDVNDVDASDFSLVKSGTLTGEAIVNVSGSGAVYTVTVSTGTGSGSLRLDVPDTGTIKNLDGYGLSDLPYTGGEAYSVRTESFADVPVTYWSWQYIERLYSAGITGGCTTSPLSYCPESEVTRAQMAVFLEKGLHYPTPFTAPNVTPTFTDTVGHWAEDWIEALKNDGITAGCATGLYCPENPVTRAQMAVFLLKAKYGSSYNPPAVGTGTGFDDVPTDHWAAAWIKQLAAESITGGCGGGNYCPESPVTRAQMAVFLVKTFNLP